MYLQFENSTAGSEQELWVLLTRHVTDRNRQADFIALKVDLDDDPNEIQSTLDLTTLAAKVSSFKSFQDSLRCNTLPPLVGKLHQQHAYIGLSC